MFDPSIESFFLAFIPLFVAIDVFAVIPFFVALTDGLEGPPLEAALRLC